MTENGALPTEVEELLVHRAERLRALRREAHADDAAIWVATFSLGEETYAIALHALRAVVPRNLVSAVPLSPPEVVGILQFQGEVVCALDLASLLGGAWGIAPSIILIVDSGEDRLVGLDFSEIPKATTLPLAAVREAQKSTAEALTEVRMTSGERVLLIDLERLLEIRNGGDGGLR